MKRLILSFFCLACLQANSQIESEHVFEATPYYVSDYSDKILPKGYEEVTHYLLYDYTNQTINIYNTDYSLIKTSFLEIPPNGVIVGSIFYPSVKLFNNDSLVEVLITWNINGDLSSVLYNEDGKILQVFEKLYPKNLIVTPDKKVKIHFIANEKDYIYSLPTTILSDMQNVKINDKITTRAYPNPTQTTICIPYHLSPRKTTTLNIYNISGKLMEQKKISYLFDFINLDVSQYPKGHYIYQYDGNKNKFIVN